MNNLILLEAICMYHRYGCLTGLVTAMASASAWVSGMAAGVGGLACIVNFRDFCRDGFSIQIKLILKASNLI